MSFEKWLATQVSAKSCLNYSQAIDGSISEWAMAAKLIDKPLKDIQDPDVLQRLLPSIKALPVFQQANKKGNGMYQAALNRYAAYLLQHLPHTAVDEDVFAVLAQQISLTEKQTLISARVGQGAFRKNLFKYWQGCAVTGYTEPSLLVASHIKPWHVCNNSERLDPYNGLLLLPNLDRAFDAGLISFKDTGEILLSDALVKPECLGVHAALHIKLKPQHLPYLHFHQEQVFQGA